VPLILASALVIFGHLISAWLAGHAAPMMRPAIYVATMGVRWSIALAGVVGVTGLIYHMGSPLQQTWYRTLPGALAATVMWFMTTLAFGWYVTRFANYTQIYGSLGTGIALLIWLYLVFLSVLSGAEINAEFLHRH